MKDMHSALPAEVWEAVLQNTAILAMSSGHGQLTEGDKAILKTVFYAGASVIVTALFEANEKHVTDRDGAKAQLDAVVNDVMAYATGMAASSMRTMGNA